MKNPRPAGAGVNLVAGRQLAAPGSLIVRTSEKTFALRFLARQLAGTADGLGLLACFFLGRFLEMLLELHFTENPFALKLFLQSTKRLIDVVVANTDLHSGVTTFLG